VGAFAAYTLRGKNGGALADLGTQFSFNDIKHAGDAWNLIFNARAFFQVF
jgi:hypothetical protein